MIRTRTTTKTSGPRRARTERTLAMPEPQLRLGLRKRETSRPDSRVFDLYMSEAGCCTDKSTGGSYEKADKPRSTSRWSDTGTRRFDECGHVVARSSKTRLCTGGCSELEQHRQSQHSPH